MPLIDVRQNTPEWRAARAGKVTASRLPDLLAKVKAGPSASRANYLTELTIEHLTGEPLEDQYVSEAMANGHERQPMAREAFELETGLFVAETGFWDHPEINLCGASPDGLIDSDIGLETKCPKLKTHLETLVSETIPTPYMQQIQWNMACTERSRWWFCSFHPAMPGPMRIFTKLVERDDAMIAAISEEVRTFVGELMTRVMILRHRYLEAA